MLAQWLLIRQSVGSGEREELFRLVDVGFPTHKRMCIQPINQVLSHLLETGRRQTWQPKPETLALNATESSLSTRSLGTLW